MRNPHDNLPGFVTDARLEDWEQDRLRNAPVAEGLRRVVLGAGGGFCIGLFGAWGSGKSSILHKLGKDLCRRKGVKVAEFDAWQYDSDSFRTEFIRKGYLDLHKEVPRDVQQDLDYGLSWAEDRPPDFSMPWLYRGVWVLGFLGLAAALLQLAREWLRSNAPPGPAAWSAVACTSGFAFAVVLIKPMMHECAKSLLKAFEPRSVTFRRSRADTPQRFTELFEKLVDKCDRKTKQIVFLIDNLDRCSPETATSILGALNTFLYNARCTYVVYVVACDDRALVRHLRKRCEDQDSEAEEYLRKIFNIVVTLPPPKASDLGRLLEAAAEAAGVNLPPVARDVITYGFVDTPREAKELVNELSAAMNMIASAGLGAVRSEEDVAQLAKVLVIRRRFPDVYGELRRNPALLPQLDACVQQVPLRLPGPFVEAADPSGPTEPAPAPTTSAQRATTAPRDESAANGRTAGIVVASDLLAFLRHTPPISGQAARVFLTWKTSAPGIDAGEFAGIQDAVDYEDADRLGAEFEALTSDEKRCAWCRTVSDVMRASAQNTPLVAGNLCRQVLLIWRQMPGDAETRSVVAAAVCQTLADIGEHYRAWVGESDTQVAGDILQVAPSAQKDDVVRSVLGKATTAAPEKAVDWLLAFEPVYDELSSGSQSLFWNGFKLAACSDATHPEDFDEFCARLRDGERAVDTRRAGPAFDEVRKRVTPVQWWQPLASSSSTGEALPSPLRMLLSLQRLLVGDADRAAQVIEVICAAYLIPELQQGTRPSIDSNAQAVVTTRSEPLVQALDRLEPTFIERAPELSRLRLGLLVKTMLDSDVVATTPQVVVAMGRLWPLFPQTESATRELKQSAFEAAKKLQPPVAVRVAECLIEVTSELRSQLAEGLFEHVVQTGVNVAVLLGIAPYLEGRPTRVTKLLSAQPPTCAQLAVDLASSEAARDQTREITAEVAKWCNNRRVQAGELAEADRCGLTIALRGWNAQPDNTVREGLENRLVQLVRGGGPPRQRVLEMLAHL
jgi:hypothetical protein